MRGEGGRGGGGDEEEGESFYIARSRVCELQHPPGLGKVIGLSIALASRLDPGSPLKSSLLAWRVVPDSPGLEQSGSARCALAGERGKPPTPAGG